jgi:protein-tyrosine phosphatase
MIDLHCHLLPGIDDGPADSAMSLAMARIAVADGIETIACTPHITPGFYDNSGLEIRAGVERLSRELADAGIQLSLVTGADVHLAPDLTSGLRSGRIPTLAGSRYFLFEPPHRVLPPRMEDVVFRLMAEGYVPILTHPERLAWIASHFDLIRRLRSAGVWMQLTAMSITGGFGRRVRYWSERLLDEGLADILATDAHDCDRRPPCLSQARSLVARRVGEAEAHRMVVTRPEGILRNLSPDEIEGLDVERWCQPRQQFEATTPIE